MGPENIPLFKNKAPKRLKGGKIRNPKTRNGGRDKGDFSQSGSQKEGGNLGNQVKPPKPNSTRNQLPGECGKKRDQQVKLNG